MPADTKKVQTFINRLDRLNTRNELEALRALFAQVNPSVTGTPLAGKKAAVNNALLAVIAAYDAHASVWEGIAESVVPTHTREAL